MGQAFIGTSGFSYSHWKGIFYPQNLPEKDWLSFYKKYFNTVEINFTFYRLPKEKTFVNWRKKAGKDFVFSLKASRFMTHIKKLKDCQEPVKRFFKIAEPIKNNKKEKEIVLFQLPPRLKANPARLEKFLEILPSGWRYAFEFRQKTWLKKEIFELLKRKKAAVVFQDFPGWPRTGKVTANFIYLRFHGKTGLYTSCYTEKQLTGWAKKIKGWLKKGLDCYAFFNNDAQGFAVENAKSLKKLI